MKRKGRKRPNIAVTLPGSIFQTLRSFGVPDIALARELGVSRSTINRASAGHSWDVSLSREEFERLKAFAARQFGRSGSGRRGAWPMRAVNQFLARGPAADRRLNGANSVRCAQAVRSLRDADMRSAATRL